MSRLAATQGSAGGAGRYQYQVGATFDRKVRKKV
jgi:hypothetical protein